MNNKKGFTLVELLAVIAILAILVIIALPNIMGMFNNAKRQLFINELKIIYGAAQKEWMSDSFNSKSSRVYANDDSNSCVRKLDISGR